MLLNAPDTNPVSGNAGLEALGVSFVLIAQQRFNRFPPLCGNLRRRPVRVRLQRAIGGGQEAIPYLHIPPGILSGLLGIFLCRHRYSGLNRIVHYKVTL